MDEQVRSSDVKIGEGDVNSNKLKVSLCSQGNKRRKLVIGRKHNSSAHFEYNQSTREYRMEPIITET